MKQYLKLITFTFLMFSLAACSANTKANPSSADATLNQQVVENLKHIRQVNDYVLQPGDLVEVHVFMEEDMDRALRISGNGTITLPLIGNQKIAGKTVLEAEQSISNALKTYLKSPQVSIFIKEYGNKTVYVLGQVAKPGSIEIPPEKPLTVLEAITSVGGFTDIANTSKVRVLRMEKNKQKTFDIDVSQITKYGDKSLDMVLMPGDVVFVPQSIF
ncbi:MAG: polysaccharide export protein [Elusimicrobiota bacterium]|jgi:polysaccharide export outer membrane protein|nr:polysaccharide export protein [Elusimicrobiota bacterium]